MMAGMNASAIPGAVVPQGADLSADSFDRAHGTAAKSEILWRLGREVHGPDYPEELQCWGMTTWWTLGRFVSGLRVAPGLHLLDLACGRGGVGLWLARASGAHLTGVDWSRVAVAEAAARVPHFGVPNASFSVGDLTDTGLRKGSIDAAVCADAVFFATDRVAVFAEMARVLVPGGRFMFTADESDETQRPSAVPDWAPIIRAGGLEVVSREVIPDWAQALQAMYTAWMDNIEDIRAALGDESAQDLLEEASMVGPTLNGRTGVLYTTERPRDRTR
jgi:ubiquinone/menaquinone biosynthesis C-methylase UbiE